MHSKALLAALLPALVAASPVAQSGGTGSALEPSPDEIQITGTSFSGNGCPGGSVSTSVSNDKTLVTFGFDAFQTYIGPGTSPNQKTKNCQLHLNLKYPGGFQFTVVDATYHGFARMDKGVTSNFITNYFFSQDAAASATLSSQIQGGGKVENPGVPYTIQDKIPSGSYVWSPCGASGILNVNNRIALSSANATAAGEVSDDDATIAFTQQLHFVWQKCTPKA